MFNYDAYKLLSFLISIDLLIITESTTDAFQKFPADVYREQDEQGQSGVDVDHGLLVPRHGSNCRPQVRRSFVPDDVLWPIYSRFQRRFGFVAKQLWTLLCIFTIPEQKKKNTLNYKMPSSMGRGNVGNFKQQFSPKDLTVSRL